MDAALVVHRLGHQVATMRKTCGLTCLAPAAPACDIVNTTAYIKKDSLALRLAGSRSLLASRL